MDRTLIRCYHSGPEWTWERWQWSGTPHSPKLQQCWNLTIKLFSVIFRTLVGGGLPLCREAVGVFYSPSRLGMTLTGYYWYIFIYIYIYIYHVTLRVRISLSLSLTCHSFLSSIASCRSSRQHPASVQTRCG